MDTANTVTIVIQTAASDEGCDGDYNLRRIAAFIGNEAAEFVLSNPDDRGATVTALVNGVEVQGWNNDGIEWAE